MKKIFTSILSLLTVTLAFAGIEGTYTTTAYTLYEASSYIFDVDDFWTINDEDAEVWNVEVALKEGNIYTITNLIGWEESMDAVYDAEAGTLTVAAGTVIYEDSYEEDGETYEYAYAIAGALSTNVSAKNIIEYSNYYSGYVYQDAIKDVVINVADGKLTFKSIYIYEADDTYLEDYGTVGYAYQIYAGYEAAMEAGEADTTIEGKYTTIDYTLYEASSYIFDVDDFWTINNEDAEVWDVEITYKEGNIYTITNLIGWEESMDAVYDAEAGTLTVAAGTVIYEDSYEEDGETYEYAYAIAGGLSTNVSAKNIIEYSNYYSGYVYQDAIKDVVINVADGKLTFKSIYIYEADDTYLADYGTVGYAYQIYAGFEASKDGASVNAIEVDNTNAPIEYYNLQGVRINNPANGQIVIKRQGTNVSKVIIR